MKAFNNMNIYLLAQFDCNKVAFTCFKVALNSTKV